MSKTGADGKTLPGFFAIWPLGFLRAEICRQRAHIGAAVPYDLDPMALNRMYRFLNCSRERLCGDRESSGLPWASPFAKN